MGRMIKPYCLKKKGDYWYYKIPPMTTYKSTFMTSKTKSEKYVIDLLEELNKKNGVVCLHVRTLVNSMSYIAL